MKQTIALAILLLLIKNADAQENQPAYAPLTIKEKTISLTGKQIDLNTDGLPGMIRTSFNLVTEPIHFHVTRSSNHTDIKWKNGEFTFKEQKPEKVSWAVKNSSDSLEMNIDGLLDAKGNLYYTVKITALDDIDLDNIRLHIPFTPETAKLIKGLGQKEGPRPNAVDWKWKAANKDQEKIWIGDVNGGLQYLLQGNRKGIPVSWANQGNGGIHIEQKGNSILADNYSGDHHMKKGEALYYNFSMLITPSPALKSK